jgi:hypothetical protein
MHSFGCDACGQWWTEQAPAKFIMDGETKRMEYGTMLVTGAKFCFEGPHCLDIDPA